MDISCIRNSYRRYAPYYDWVFGPVFARGRRTAIDTLTPLAGKRVLEVGVGTGISLSLYGPDVEIVGIDLSRPMLSVAQRRLRHGAFPSVLGLAEMNAEALAFPADSFDAVVAMYVATVVPDPQRLFAEMWRVCRPGGSLLFLNHFASRQWALRAMEQGLRPWSRTVGFRPDMELQDFIAVTGQQPLSVRPACGYGYWKQIHFAKTG